jgi:hypothetical protein
MVPLDDEDTSHYSVMEKMGLEVVYMSGMEEEIGNDE